MTIAGNPEKRPKILQIFSRYREFGGEEGSVLRIGDAMSRDFDIGFFLASSANAFEGSAVHKGLSVVKAFHNWSVVQQLRHYQKLGQYDFWQIHNVFPVMSPAVYSLAFDLGIPVVQYLHNYRLGCVNGFFLNHGEPCRRCMGGNFLPALQTACWHESHLESGIMGAITRRVRTMDVFNRVHRWVAISEAQKKIHVEMGVPEEKIRVLNHFYEPNESPPTYPVGGDVLFVGRLSAEKGVDRLLLAWERIQGCGRKLMIVGDGPERAKLEEFVRSKGLRNVKFMGFIERDAMSEIWARAACSIIPSIWEEPFGMVVLEAWANGRPVVAHSVGALPELITHRGDGLLVSMDSPSEMASAIQCILDDPALGASMGSAGHARLLRDYSKSGWQNEIRSVFT